MKPQVIIIAAIGKNKELGKGNDLLWRIREDLKRFSWLTTGHPVIMGRKTFDSIPGRYRPLPGRTNIVVTNQPEKYRKEHGSFERHPTMDKIYFVGTIEEAIDKAKTSPGGQEIFVIGGAQIYTQTLPYADKLYLTVIDDEKEADVFFPEYEQFFTEKKSEEHATPEGLKYRWVDLEK